MARAAAVQLVVQIHATGAKGKFQSSSTCWELAGYAGRIMGRAQVARDDKQLAVARAVFVGGEFHGDRTFVLVKMALAPSKNYAG